MCTAYAYPNFFAAFTLSSSSSKNTTCFLAFPNKDDADDDDSTGSSPCALLISSSFIDNTYRFVNASNIRLLSFMEHPSVPPTSFGVTMLFFFSLNAYSAKSSSPFFPSTKHFKYVSITSLFPNEAIATLIDFCFISRKNARKKFASAQSLS